MVDALNAGTGGAVTASLTAGGTGIQLTDAAGGTAGLTVAAGATATALGLTGTAATGTLSGKDLDRQWLTGSTLLSGLNGGQGIGDGSFTITTAAGASTTVTVDSSVTTVAQLLYQINSKGVAGLTASVNATGNGIQVNDASGGAGQLSIADATGTAATDLNLAGTAATGTTSIDGAYSKTVTLGPNDTLTSAAAAINAADAGVTATLISDGSSTNPYRLSITADHSGSAGGVTFDAGTTGLAAQTLVAAQDAAVFVGGSSSNGSSGAAAAQPLLVTSATNSVSDVIQGVTLNLLNVSPGTVNLTVAADPDDLVKSLGSFTDTYNALSTSISSQSTYNTSSQTGGLLLGDPVALGIQSGLSSLLNATVPGNGDYKTLYNVGFAVDNTGALTFDEDAFRAAFAKDPAAVQALFNATATTTTANASSGSAANGSTGAVVVNTGVAYAIDQTLTHLVDPISGTVTAATNELSTEERGFNDQITQLNALLDEKKAVYEEQFANMESALASLQSISSTLGSIGSLGASTTSKSSSSSSSSSS